MQYILKLFILFISLAIFSCGKSKDDLEVYEKVDPPSLTEDQVKDIIKDELKTLTRNFKSDLAGNQKDIKKEIKRLRSDLKKSDKNYEDNLETLKNDLTKLINEKIKIEVSTFNIENSIIEESPSNKEEIAIDEETDRVEREEDDYYEDEDLEEDDYYEDEDLEEDDIDYSQYDLEALEGGEGFEDIAEELGWETNEDYKIIGDFNAKKGGAVTLAMSEYPPTLRTLGKDTQLQILGLIEGLVYETLLGIDSETLEYTPGLATDWKISKDEQTFWFRINPDARWSDGTEVTAEDVVATYKLLIDEGIQHPVTNEYYREKYKEPIAESKYIVRIDCKKPEWRAFMGISTTAIFPSEYLKRTSGEDFLKKYNDQLLPGTGPYVIDHKKTKNPEKLTLKRRNDWWGEDLAINTGLYNFDEIVFRFVLDDRLQMTKFIEGEFDVYFPGRAQWWVQELNAENVSAIRDGLIQKRKIFNYKALGVSGLVFNANTWPFNDIDMRKAFIQLWDVDELLRELFYDEYIKCRSYFMGTVYENSDNPVLDYNPTSALRILESKGWSKKPGDEWMTNSSGDLLEVTFELDASWDRIFLPYKDNLAKYGIKLNLKHVLPQKEFENKMSKKFTIGYQGWTGSLFPNPKGMMHSQFGKSDVLNTTNMTGMQNAEIDSLIGLYDKEYDAKKRIPLLYELDKIAVSDYHYGFGWVAPYGVRVCYWNKLSYPSTGVSYSGSWTSILSMWWVDPEKDSELSSIRESGTGTMPVGNIEVDYWNKNNK